MCGSTQMMLAGHGSAHPSPPEGPTDEELAARLASGNDQFSLLYARYKDPIYSFIRAHMRDDAAAEDATAQVFCRVFTSGDTFRNEGSFRAWIFQIARNTIATRSARAPNREVPLELIAQEPTSHATPLVVALADEELAEVNRTVESLPDAQREVIRLRYWTELSIDEIATVTRRSSVAVRQLLHRARKHLARRLSRKDLTVLLGATGASAVAATYSYRRRRREKR